MATFEAFLDHFDRVPQHQSAWRSSLRFNRDRAHHTGKPDLGKAVLWALLLVMHAGFFVALDLLMQHTPSVLDDREQADDALQLRVIRVRQISAPKAESEPTTTVSRESAQQAVKRVPRPQPLPARAITI